MLTLEFLESNRDGAVLVAGPGLSQGLSAVPPGTEQSSAKDLSRAEIAPDLDARLTNAAC